MAAGRDDGEAAVARRLLDGTLQQRVDERVVGLADEAEILAATLATGCHVVLEGPPGTGKSTLLRAIADAAGLGVAIVEGNAELTPARLVGHHDPAMVLEGGYSADAFVDGALLTALREGRLLYIEELNRVPEETLNVLVGALAEREIHVPRLGTVGAAPGFRLIAAMNPFDAVGTARVSQAIADRMCRISLGYQTQAAEARIVVAVTGLDGPLIGVAVQLVRLTREHADVYMGSSVRGAIDLTRLATGLAQMRGHAALGIPGAAGPERDATWRSFTRAALAALSGRLRLEEGCERTPESIIEELLERVRPVDESEDADGGGQPPGEAERPDPQPSDAGRPGAGRTITGEEAQDIVKERSRRTKSRHDLAADHPSLEQVSPDVGQLDPDALGALAAEDPDAAVALLADLAAATDPKVRAEARRLAARIFLRTGRIGGGSGRGYRRLVAEPGGLDEGDLDLERSLDRAGGRPRRAEHLVVRRWAAPRRAVCLLVDHSGSMAGQAVGLAGMAAAAVVVATRDRPTASVSVVAFARDALVLKRQEDARPVQKIVDDLLSLRGKGQTDLALALRTAERELRGADGAERVVLVLSDCRSTTGEDPLGALRGIDRVHVLGTSDEEEALVAGRRLARHGRGRFVAATRAVELRRGLTTVLA